MSASARSVGRGWDLLAQALAETLRSSRSERWGAEGVPTGTEASSCRAAPRKAGQGFFYNWLRTKVPTVSQSPSPLWGKGTEEERHYSLLRELGWL